MDPLEQPAEKPKQTDDEFLDTVVDNYIQKRIAAGASEGKSPAEIESSLNTASLILTVRMLQDWNGGEMPEGAELLWGLGDLTGASEAECRDICRVFVAAGWLDAAYTLTETGRRVVGMES